MTEVSAVSSQYVWLGPWCYVPFTTNLEYERLFAGPNPDKIYVHIVWWDVFSDRSECDREIWRDDVLEEWCCQSIWARMYAQLDAAVSAVNKNTKRTRRFRRHA